jgi:hypothetical protein
MKMYGGFDELALGASAPKGVDHEGEIHDSRRLVPAIEGDAGTNASRIAMNMNGISEIFIARLSRDRYRFSVDLALYGISQLAKILARHELRQIGVWAAGLIDSWLQSRAGPFDRRNPRPPATR